MWRLSTTDPPVTVFQSQLQIYINRNFKFLIFFIPISYGPYQFLFYPSSYSLRYFRLDSKLTENGVVYENQQHKVFHPITRHNK